MPPRLLSYHAAPVPRATHRGAGAASAGGTAAPAAASAPDGYRPQVTESGNEISCSVDETNRLRASLGLKPLQIETKEEREAAARRKEEDAVRRKEEAEAADIRAYLEKRRQQRLLHAKVDGQSLGEELAGTAVTGSALDWIERSRALAAQPKPAPKSAVSKAPTLRDADDEDEDEEDAAGRGTSGGKRQAASRYSSQALAGMKVRHDVNAWNKGDEVVLTLKDDFIIKDGDVNDDEDELESTAIKEAETTARNNAIRAKKPHQTYPS